LSGLNAAGLGIGAGNVRTGRCARQQAGKLIWDSRRFCSPQPTNDVYTNVDPVLRQAISQLPVAEWVEDLGIIRRVSCESMVCEVKWEISAGTKTVIGVID
jgi:hypothetical protein